MDTHLMLVQAAVHPQALDRRKLHRNALDATSIAISAAFAEVR
jgi:formaldehyde-activating enzyme involved in methanogenesis